MSSLCLRKEGPRQGKGAPKSPGLLGWGCEATTFTQPFPLPLPTANARRSNIHRFCGAK